MIRVNLGCGKDYRRGYVNVDISEQVEADVYQDAIEYLEGRDNESVDEILAYHVVEHFEPERLLKFFQEAERVLTTSGVLRVKVPVGLDAKTDPTHRNRWTPITPYYFTDFNQYGWETGVSLNIIKNSVDWYWWKLGKRFTLPIRLFDRYVARNGLQEIPFLSGEMTVEYVKVPQ